MLVIASSIMCATFNFRFLVMLLLVATATLFVVRSGWRRKSAPRDGILIVAVRDDAAKAKWTDIENLASQCARHCTLESSTSQAGTTSMQFSFSDLKVNVAQLKETLGNIVEAADLSVYFNRPGG
jgi:hypothetical protein